MKRFAAIFVSAFVSLKFVSASIDEQTPTPRPLPPMWNAYDESTRQLALA